MKNTRLMIGLSIVFFLSGIVKADVSSSDFQPSATLSMTLDAKQESLLVQIEMDCIGERLLLDHPFLCGTTGAPFRVNLIDQSGEVVQTFQNEQSQDVALAGVRHHCFWGWRFPLTGSSLRDGTYVVKAAISGDIQTSRCSLNWSSRLPAPLQFTIENGKFLDRVQKPVAQGGAWSDEQISVFCQTHALDKMGNRQEVLIRYENCTKGNIRVVAPFLPSYGIVRKLKVLDNKGSAIGDLFANEQAQPLYGKPEEFRSAAQKIPPGCFVGCREEVDVTRVIRGGNVSISPNHYFLRLDFCQHLLVENWPHPLPTPDRNRLSSCGIFMGGECKEVHTDQIPLRADLPEDSRGVSQ